MNMLHIFYTDNSAVTDIYTDIIVNPTLNYNIFQHGLKPQQ